MAWAWIPGGTRTEWSWSRPNASLLYGHGEKRYTYLSMGIPLSSIPSRQEVATTDASPSGWGAIWQHRTTRGPMECPADIRAYKCVRASHCAPSSKTLSSILVRQHLNCLPHKPPRGNQIQPVITGGTGAPPMGLSPQNCRPTAPFGSPELSSPLGQDALVHAWPDSLLFAFPPSPLVKMVLHRILQGSHRILLVDLNWQGRMW